MDRMPGMAAASMVLVVHVPLATCRKRAESFTICSWKTSSFHTQRGGGIEEAKHPCHRHTHGDDGNREIERGKRRQHGRIGRAHAAKRGPRHAAERDR